MKNTALLAAGFLSLTSNLANGAPHDFRARVDSIVAPSGCARTGSDESTAYESGYSIGVSISDHAFDSYGDCASWDKIVSLINQLKVYVEGVDGIDEVDLCRLGGIADAISDRELESQGLDYCVQDLTCGERGAVEGPQYAETYCMIATAAGFCFDPGPYTRGPIGSECEDNFEVYCDYYFTKTARTNSSCYPYTTGGSWPAPACLEAFVNYRDFICDW